MIINLMLNNCNFIHIYLRVINDQKARPSCETEILSYCVKYQNATKIPYLSASLEILFSKYLEEN